MFVEFFYFLRSRGLPVSVTEWLTLMEALADSHAGESLTGFYFLSRAICVKNESLYDLWDQCFLAFFHGAESPPEVTDEVLEWLKNAKLPKELSPEFMKMLRQMDPEEIKKLFEQRLKEQKERHDGGNKWVGTGGTSPFGNNGTHPDGIRVGGEGKNKSAMSIATKRTFKNLRKDIILDTRQISVALKKLRHLKRDGLQEELDLDWTIDATARNAGDIDLMFRPVKNNNIRLLLLLDVGGSMTPHTRVCERLFSAALGARHFKEVRFYYFHNCPYEVLFTDIERQKSMRTEDVLKELDTSWNLMMVGDAAMNPYELMAPGGSVDYYHHNEEPGIQWLQRINKRFPRNVWINPDPESWWHQVESTRTVRKVFPDMFPMTVTGLEEAVDTLRRKNQRLTESA